jgi:hypothetical protein
VETREQIGLPQLGCPVRVCVFQQISVIQRGLGWPNRSMTLTSSSVCSTMNLSSHASSSCEDIQYLALSSERYGPRYGAENAVCKKNEK